MKLALILLFLQSAQLFQVVEKPYRPSSDSLITTAWTVEEGLPVNTVNEVLQDSTGYIWLTTYDGIVRFDGLDFNVFTHANTLAMPQNRAVFMLPQDGRKLWITLENGGVLLKNGDEFRHYGEAEGFVNSNVIDMMKDSNGDVWFASFDGAHLYKDGQFQKILDRDSDLKNQVNFVYEDTDGSVWFATADGVVRWDGESTEVYRAASEEQDNHFRGIIRTPGGEIFFAARTGVYTLQNNEMVSPDRLGILREQLIHLFIESGKGSIYFASDNGLYEYSNSRLRSVPGNENPQSVFISYFEDDDGTIWMTNTDGDAYFLRNGELTRFDFPGDSEQVHVNRIMKDREGNVWLATARDGLMRVKTTHINSITTENGLSGNNILGMFEDRSGNFWIGTRDYGLNKIGDDKIITFLDENSLLKNIVHTINQDSDGNIWVGYYNGGHVKFDQQTGKQYSYSIGPTEKLNDIRSIFIRSDSTMWIGTYGGLVHFDPVNFNHRYYTVEDGLSDDLIRYIDEDHEGALWIGTVQGGINYFKDGHFKSYTEDDGLASNNIRSVYVDEFDPGTVWVGTETNGISRIRNGEIHSLGTAQGLPDHVIHYISQDSLGYLWMSSNRGIFKLNKSLLNSYLDGESDYYDLIHYDKSDGMLNPEANGSFQQGGIRTSDGDFWFATQEGVAIFPSRYDTKKIIPPTVYITQVSAEGIPVEASGNRVFGLNRGVRNVTVEYHSLTFTSPEKARFRYKLEGYENEWHEVYNQRAVTYTDLPAGEYTFLLLSANNQGVWNETPERATIIVTDHFHQQWWFISLLIMLIVAGYYPFSKIRYRYLVKRQKKLHAVIRGKTAELRNEKKELQKKNRIIEKQALKLQEINNTKDKFFSIIAHDLRNPFQAILGFTELLKQEITDNDDESLKENLHQIDIAGKRVFNLLENLLEWSRLQTGGMKPNPKLLNVREIVTQVVLLLEQHSRKKGIVIFVDTSEDIMVYADQNMLRTVLRNIISNAIKFTEKEGKIIINASEDEPFTTISIEDTGIGIPQEILDRLMALDGNVSRYGTSDEKGSGLGLLICKEMISLHDGELGVESEEGAGTCFKIMLPKKDDHESQ